MSKILVVRFLIQVFLYVLLGANVLAKSPHAHAHGLAKIAIAFDGLNGEIDFESPSQGVYGFEYAPKIDKDRRTQTESLEKLDKSIGQMVQFQNELGCVISKNKIEVSTEGKHSEVTANFKIICQKEVAGSFIEFNIQKFFPKLHVVEVVLIAGEIQKSVKASTIGTRLEIKK